MTSEKSDDLNVNIHEYFNNAPASLNSIEFYGVGITKRDALIKEVAELFKTKNL